MLMYYGTYLHIRAIREPPARNTTYVTLRKKWGCRGVLRGNTHKRTTQQQNNNTRQLQFTLRVLRFVVLSSCWCLLSCALFFVLLLLFVSLSSWKSSLFCSFFFLPSSFFFLPPLPAHPTQRVGFVVFLSFFPSSHLDPPTRISLLLVLLLLVFFFFPTHAHTLSCLPSLLPSNMQKYTIFWCP